MNGGMVKRYRFNNQTGTVKRRCDLCHLTGNELYHAQFEVDGPYYWLHPLNCFQNAQKNYTEKKDKGITPTVTPVIESPFNEVMTDSIEGEQNIANTE